MKNIKCVFRSGSKNSNNEKLIYLRYTYNRKSVFIRTDVYSKPYLFNKESGRVKKSENYDEKNLILHKKENELEKIILDLMLKNDEPTLDIVKSRYIQLNNETHKINSVKLIKSTQNNFFTELKKFIEYREQYETVGKGSIKTYKTTYNTLQLFNKYSIANYDTQITFNNINQLFYDRFLLFLRKERNLLDNSIDKHIKNIKLFMKESLNKKLHTNLQYITLKRTKNNTDFVELNRIELRNAIRFDFSHNRLYDRVRDMFILGCLSGLRFQDIYNLSKENFKILRLPNNKISMVNENSYISIYTEKTDTSVQIPMNKFISHLVNKYDIENKELTFNKISNQKFNIYIKEVCKEIGFTKEVKIVKKRGNEKVEMTKPLYDFISSHTMRRSFISIVAKKMHPAEGRKLTGHTDVNVFSRYTKEDTQAHNIILKHLNSDLMDDLFNDECFY